MNHPKLIEGMQLVPCSVSSDGWLYIPHADGKWVSATKLQPFSQKVIEHWQEAAQEAPPAPSDLVEPVARVIYDQWKNMTGWVPWVDGGNSHKQDDARRLARDALAAAATPAAPQAEDARDAVFNEFAEFVTVNNKERSVPWPLAELFVRHYRAAIRAAMEGKP